MDQNWQPYTDVAAASRHGRYSQSTGQQPANGSAQHQPHSGYSYEAYQNNSVPSQPQSMAVSPIGTPRTRAYSGDGDVAMEDADPYNRMKYPSRPTHSQRPSAQYLGQEDSSAAKRYSPMKALSPSSPYAPSSQQSSQSPYGHYASQTTSARQSPTRSNHYSTPTQSYYSTPSESSSMPSSPSRLQPTKMQLKKRYNNTNCASASSRQPPLQLPPIHPNSDSTDQFYPHSATAQLNAVFGRETKSPRQMRPVHAGTADMPRGPVPRFNKLDSVQDLQPRIHPQPAFRRADPEGGFISVSLLD